MSVWDSVGTTYVEAATSALPLHRVVVFIAAVLGSLAVRHQTHLSILETVANISVLELTAISTGVFSRAVLADAAVGFAVVLGGWAFARVTLLVIFALAARSTDLWDRVREASKNLKVDSTQPLADRQAAMEIIDASLADPKARLRSFAAAAELAAGCGMGCLAASYWGNILDALTGIFLVAVTASIQVHSVRLFLAEYFGPALLKAQLQGKRPPSPAVVM